MNSPEPILTGIAASGGTATGRVKIVSSIKDAPSFEDGAVLVTTITDPSMVMMMAKACAIVCDVGGITSHPSIVSREMGVPCVVNTKNATTILKDGQMVRVDGSLGKVYLED